MNALRKHMNLLIEDAGEKNAMAQMRGLASWYFKGLPASRAFKARVSSLNHPEELEAIIEEFMEASRMQETMREEYAKDHTLNASESTKDTDGEKTEL